MKHNLKVGQICFTVGSAIVRDGTLVEVITKEEAGLDCGLGEDDVPIRELSKGDSRERVSWAIDRSKLNPLPEIEEIVINEAEF